MKKILLIIGYIFIFLSGLTLLLEFLPFDVTSKISIWLYSLFDKNSYHDTYIKIVPSKSSFILAAIEFIVGFAIILLTKHKRKS